MVYGQFMSVYTNMGGLEHVYQYGGPGVCISMQRAQSMSINTWAQIARPCISILDQETGEYRGQRSQGQTCK